MSENAIRQFSKDKGGYYSNTLQKVSHSDSANFIKCPINIGESLKWNANNKAWKDFKLYVKYLDMKAQNPNVGTFKVFHSHRYYQRTVNQLIAKGWALREGRTIHLKAYQFVWREMGINRLEHNGKQRFKYWKLPIDSFSDERKTYLKEIEHELRERITKRKLAQIRRALKDKGETRATFSAKSASATFGYKSASTGSKLRQKYFQVIPMTPEESRPRFNKKHGRFEEPTKQIAV
jgi:hypothetical protein